MTGQLAIAQWVSDADYLDAVADVLQVDLNATDFTHQRVRKIAAGLRDRGRIEGGAVTGPEATSGAYGFDPQSTGLSVRASERKPPTPSDLDAHPSALRARGVASEVLATGAPSPSVIQDS